MTTCTATFDNVELADPTAVQTTVYTETLSVIQDVISVTSQNGDVQTLLTDYVLTFVATIIWPFLFLVFFVLFALPLCIARCCCTTNCCKPKKSYVVPGYPCGGCCGFGAATIVWLLLWVLLTILAIYLPFSLWDVGHALANWVDAVCATLDSIGGLVQGAVTAVNNVIALILDAVQDVVDAITDLLNTANGSLLSINGTIAEMTSALRTGCVTIQNSPAYQNLSALSPGLTYDCDFDFGSDTSQAVDVAVSAIDTAKDTVDGLVDTVNSTISVADEISTQLSDVEASVTQIVTEILGSNISVGAGLDALSTIGIDLPTDQETYTAEEITDAVVAIFPVLIAIPSVFTYFGVLFFILGFLLLCCIKCAAQRDRGDSESNSGLAERNKEIKNGCCGRCLTKFGCVCSFCGGFVLTFIAMISLLLVPITNNMVATYYVAPYAMNETVEFVESMMGQSLGSDVDTYVAIANDCFFGSGSLSSIATELGFDLQELLSQFSLADLDVSSYTNFSTEINAARDALDTLETTLTGEKFSNAQVAAAEDAALRCCNYDTLFSEFTDDCGDGSSVCFQCQNIAHPTDCVATPNTCNPSPGDNLGLNKLCNDLANNALSIMQQTNDLLDGQSVSIDSMRADVDDIEALDVGGTVNALLTSIENDLPTQLTDEVESASCSGVGQLYYGLYDILLLPIAQSLTTFAVVLTLVIFVSIVLVWVNIPLNVRLGNDGIDVNNVAATAQPADAAEVEIEMPSYNKDPLPVAEPVDTAQAGSGRQASYHADKVDDYGGQDY